MGTQRYSFAQDCDCHWFMLPEEYVTEFNIDCEDYEMAESGDFDNKWGQYRIGGGPQSWTFENPEG